MVKGDWDLTPLSHVDTSFNGHFDCFSTTSSFDQQSVLDFLWLPQYVMTQDLHTCFMFWFHLFIIKLLHPVEGRMQISCCLYCLIVKKGNIWELLWIYWKKLIWSWLYLHWFIGISILASRTTTVSKYSCLYEVWAVVYRQYSLNCKNWLPILFSAKSSWHIHQIQAHIYLVYSNLRTAVTK